MQALTVQRCLLGQGGLDGVGSLVPVYKILVCLVGSAVLQLCALSCCRALCAEPYYSLA